MAFNQNVFVNCPFDKTFYPLLRPLLFTIIYLGLKPRIATERLDSGEARITKIVELIEDSKYAIHDLSRIKATKKGEFYRLNMPFELGIDVGCRLFKGGEHEHKKCLILVAEPYNYQAAISDLSNSDVANHHKETPEDVVIEVRNWLSATCGLEADGPSRIWDAFNVFMGDNYSALIARGFSKQDIEKLPVQELIQSMERWVTENV
uniref:Uncharacterized protein n=1 Tax=Chlorobium chlorochromatii (strain CaD3) TaxID=340177 RepID=Q3ATH5_CHLCH